MQDAEPSNVVPLIGDSGEPETLLRNALARCAEIRAKGLKPAIVAMTMEPGRSPTLVWSGDECEMAILEARLRTTVLDLWRAMDERPE